MSISERKGHDQRNATVSPLNEGTWRNPISQDLVEEVADKVFAMLQRELEIEGERFRVLHSGSNGDR
jgi:hypothetical protein